MISVVAIVGSHQLRDAQDVRGPPGCSARENRQDFPARPSSDAGRAEVARDEGFGVVSRATRSRARRTSLLNTLRRRKSTVRGAKTFAGIDPAADVPQVLAVGEFGAGAGSGPDRERCHATR